MRRGSGLGLLSPPMWIVRRPTFYHGNGTFGASTVRSPERGASRAPEGVPKPRHRALVFGWQVHMVPDPGSAIRSDRGEPPRRHPKSRIQTPDADQLPSPSQMAETRFQSPERAPQGPRREGLIPQVPESGLRREEARPRQQREGRAPGSRVGLAGEGAARGRIQRGREGEAGLRGSLVLMKAPRKQAALSPAGTRD